MKQFVWAGLVALLAAPVFAQDRADIDRTQIIGNRELPKVLYIVPWKKPLPGDLAGRLCGGPLYLFDSLSLGYGKANGHYHQGGHYHHRQLPAIDKGLAHRRSPFPGYRVQAGLKPPGGHG